MRDDLGAVDLRIHLRWPWQTREDVVIRLLNEALEDADRTRARAAEITQAARRDVERMRDAEGS